MTDSLTRFQQLLTDAWDSRMQRDPLYATLCGDRRYSDRLPEAKKEAAEGQRQAYRDALARLAGIPRGELPPAEQVNYDVFGHVLHGSGPLPLSLLEQWVVEWISAQKGPPA